MMRNGDGEGRKNRRCRIGEERKREKQGKYLKSREKSQY